MCYRLYHVRCTNTTCSPTGCPRRCSGSVVEAHRVPIPPPSAEKTLSTNDRHRLERIAIRLCPGVTRPESELRMLWDPDRNHFVEGLFLGLLRSPLGDEATAWLERFVREPDIVHPELEKAFVEEGLTGLAAEVRTMVRSFRSADDAELYAV